MPPKETDDIEDMEVESSTASEDTNTGDTVDTTVEQEPAGSSAATDSTEVDTLSIVRDVVGAEQEPTEAASSAEGEEVEALGEGEQTPKDPEGDEFSDVPFNQHPRWRQLVDKFKSVNGDAQEFRKIKAYMDANALSAEEAANGVTIMGLAKLNPVEAFKQVAPWFKQLAIAAGEILPDDLASRVQKNELTKEAAFEISRLQAAQKAGSVRQEFEQKRGQQTQQMESLNAVRGAAEQWETDRQLKDPNFAAKLPRIQEKIAFLHATGQRPTTPEGVLEQLKLVYAAVNREAGAAAAAVTRQQPKKPAIAPVRAAQVAGNARPEPKNTLDIIRAARQRA